MYIRKYKSIYLICYFINCLHGFPLHSSATVSLILTWVHLAYLLYEGLIKTCDYGATYWNHKVLVQALNKGVDSSNTSPLMEDTFKKTHAITGQVKTSTWTASKTSDKWWVTPACCMRCMHLDDCTPYALFTMWGMLYLAHTAASSSSLQAKMRNLLEMAQILFSHYRPS